MRGIPILAGFALALSAPASAEDSAADANAVLAGADAFFEALGSDEKNAMAAAMIADAVIFLHNHGDPTLPGLSIIPVTDHLAAWAMRSSKFSERMRYDHVLIHGSMAQIWGPYSFTMNDQVTHCGINSLSMVRPEDMTWKVGNISYTMVAAERCAEVGADWVGADSE